MSDDEIDHYVHELQIVSLLVSIPVFQVDAVVPSDPDDDPIVATAVACGAAVLCTRDRHLHRRNVVEYCGARGIEVITDLKLLERLRSAAS